LCKTYCLAIAHLALVVSIANGRREAGPRRKKAPHGRGELHPRGCPDARGECGAVIVRCINYMRNIKWILPFRKTEQKGLSVILHRWGTLSLKSVRFLARTDRWKGTTDLLSSPTCPPSKRERCQRLARRSGSTIPGLDSRTGKSPVRQEMTSSHGKHASSRTIGKC